METHEVERELWAFLERHLRSIFACDSETYRQTTSEDLSLYEWFVTPHRQDGLDFHFFMIDHGWAGDEGDLRYDLLERRLQLYGEPGEPGETAIATYTFMLTRVANGSITHRTHNESRVLIRFEDGWRVVHVHKSPADRNP